MYPSSADLAAFRRDLMPSWFDNPYPHRPDAWPDELRDGIGSQTGNAYGMQQAWRARREASAMRSRAYLAGTCVACDQYAGPEGCACYGIPVPTGSGIGTGSIVHGGIACFHCDHEERHAADCVWNIDRP